jgi:galactose-6-phosphate isomerase
MPLIDVSDLMTDPDFCETLTLIRRTQTVDANGRGTTTEAQSSIIGVVTSGPSDSLTRSPEYGASSRAITVHTQFRLRDTSNGLLPDKILWLGTRYIVDRVRDYSRFGAGFTAAECIVIDPVQSAT